MDTTELLQTYAAGPRLLREAVKGMSRDALLARPVPGKWSTLEVVCHIADFEPIYADRMKRVLAEDNPTLLSGDPDRFAAKLAYHSRDMDEELAIIENVRGQMVRILKAVQPSDFLRTGTHTEAGPLSVQELLRRVTSHLPHHVQFIAEKRKALG